jgi:hypothetical protein
MRIVKVILAAINQLDQIEVETNPHGISIKDEVCQVIVPKFDHWTNTENFSFHGLGVSSKVAGEQLVVEFPNDDTRSRFHIWLTEAFTKAEAGYKTMWP